MKFIQKFLGVLLTLMLLSTSAAADTLLFLGEGCEHCAIVEQYLESQQQDESALPNLQTYDIYTDKSDAALFNQITSELNLTNQGIPFLYIEEDNFYISGSDQVIEYLENPSNMDDQSSNTSSDTQSADSSLDLLHSEAINEIIKDELKSEPVFLTPDKSLLKDFFPAIIIVAILSTFILISIALKHEK